MTAPAIDPKARHVSVWTTRQKVARQLWYFVEATVFRFSPRPMYRWRAWLLRCFGAKVHPTARIRPTATVEVPWNLTVGADSSVGDGAILYCLGTVRIGDRVMISQYAHLCAGTHDHTRPDMPLIKATIAVEDDAWIAADAFVGPDVTVGRGALLGARASAFKDVPAWKIYAGNPAREIGDRELHSTSPGTDA